MGRGQLAKERQLGRCLVTVRAASGEASVLGTVLATVLTTGSPPPSMGLMRGALIRRAGPRLGRAKIEKWEGKGKAGQAGLSFQLGFGPLPNRN
jgi:hypothetical protein